MPTHRREEALTWFPIRQGNPDCTTDGRQEREHPLDEQRIQVTGERDEQPRRTTAGAIEADECEEQAGEQQIFLVRADSEDEGDRKELQRPGQRARRRRRHEPRRQHHEHQQAGDLRSQRDHERGLNRWIPGATEKRRQDEGADRVLAEEPLHTPRAPPLRGDPSVQRLRRQPRRDSDVHTRVGVARGERCCGQEHGRHDERDEPPRDGRKTMIRERGCGHAPPMIRACAGASSRSVTDFHGSDPSRTSAERHGSFNRSFEPGHG